MAEHQDVVVIGAGMSGLAAARFYLHVHPTCKLVILEREDCVGGTWNRARSFDYFMTQWAHPYATYSDLEMPEPPQNDMYYGFYKASHQTKYLEAYADHHDFCGQSLRDRVRFCFDVKSVTKDEKQKLWTVVGHDSKQHSEIIITAPKLIIASGRTSEATMPALNGADEFNAPIIHMLDFARSQILSNEEVQYVSVLGGGKSAADMVYAAVKAGKIVSWIFHGTGVGPAVFLPAKGMGPFRGSFDLASLRAVSSLSPTVVRSSNFVERLLHQTERGASWVRAMWAGAEADASKLADYDKRLNKKDFDKLKPHSSLMWQNVPAGFVNRDDFWETVAQGASMYYDEIVELQDHKIILKEGGELRADTLLCGTGWGHGLHYLPDDLRAQLGLPYSHEATPPDIEQRWAGLEAECDKEILAKFPILRNPPDVYIKRLPHTPFRLYQGIAPLDDHTVAMVGQVGCPNYARLGECQAIWATAYLDGKIKLPSREEMERDIATKVAFNKRRYLSLGEYGNNYTFDFLDHTDALLEQLGLTSHKSGFLHHFFYPSEPSSLKGLADEYIQKYSTV